MLMESNTGERERDTLKEGMDQTRENPQRKRHARDSTLRVDAISWKKNFTSDTSVKDAEKPDTESPHATWKNTNEMTNGMRPKYLRYNIWDPNSDFSPNIVLPKFGSEPKFEPEPLGPNSKFSSRFRIFAELNLRSSSRFS